MYKLFTQYYYRTTPHFEYSAQQIIKEGRVKAKAVEDIKSWLETTTIPELTDEQIVMFLLAHDGAIHETQKTINYYYKCRRKAPEIFDNRDIDCRAFREVFNVIDLAVVPKRMNDGKAIIITRLRDKEFTNQHAEAFLKALCMCIDLLLIEYPPTSIVFIVDMKEIGLMHFTRYGYSLLNKFIKYVQVGLPVKLGAIHIFNCFFVYEKFIALIKPFLRTEMHHLVKTHHPGMSMAHFYKKYDIPPDCMPSDYQGLLPSIEDLHANTFANFKKYKTFFETEEKQRLLYKKS